MTTTARVPPPPAALASTGDGPARATTGYDESRTVWNAMIDRRPRDDRPLRQVADVVTAVRTARERDLEIGVRCGGHNVAGLAVPDDGLMIDLTGDGPRRRRSGARASPGCRAARCSALWIVPRSPTGWRRPRGNVSHTGVGGLTLGGGMGWLARQHGLACDNVVSFTVVTADGDVVRASAHGAPRPVLGAARRWRQLRHRHRVRVPAAPRRDARARRRPHLPARSSGGRAARLARPERRGAAAGHVHRRDRR